MWSILPEYESKAIERNGSQDNGCQDNPRADALGEIGDHTGMITCLRRMGKFLTILNHEKRKSSKVNLCFPLRSSCVYG
jgi:hypothetical protein